MRTLEAEQALRASEERLRLTIIAAEVGIWEHDLAADHFLMDPRAQAAVRPGRGDPDGRVPARASTRTTWTACGARSRRRWTRRAARPWPRSTAWCTPTARCAGCGCRGAWSSRRTAPAARPLRGLGTVQDVTAHREAEIALRQSDARYRTLFDSIDEGFCVVEVIFDARRAAGGLPVRGGQPGVRQAHRASAGRGGQARARDAARA